MKRYAVISESRNLPANGGGRTAERYANPHSRECDAIYMVVPT